MSVHKSYTVFIYVDEKRQPLRRHMIGQSGPFTPMTILGLGSSTALGELRHNSESIRVRRQQVAVMHKAPQ